MISNEIEKHKYTITENLLDELLIPFKLELIDADKIKETTDFQIRKIENPIPGFTQLSQGIFGVLKEDYKSECIFPAIILRETNKGYQIIDGRHRFHVWSEGEEKKIPAYVISKATTNDDCNAIASRSNDSHGTNNESDASTKERKNASYDEAIKTIIQNEPYCRDLNENIAAIAKTYKLGKHTLKSRFQNKKVRALAISFGITNTETITQGNSDLLYEMVFLSSPEDAKKLIETTMFAMEKTTPAKVNELLKKGLNSRISVKDIAESIQIDAGIDVNGKALATGLIVMSRRVDLLINSVADADGQLKSNKPAALVMGPEKKNQLFSLLKILHETLCGYRSALESM